MKKESKKPDIRGNNRKERLTDLAPRRNRRVLFHWLETGAYPQEEIDRVIMAIVEIGPWESAELTARPDQRYLGEDSFTKVYLMSPFLVGRHHQIGRSQHTWIKVDRPEREIMYLVAKLRFKLMTRSLDLYQPFARNRSLKRKEPPLQFGPHLFGVLASGRVGNIDSLSLDAPETAFQLTQCIRKSVSR